MDDELKRSIFLADFLCSDLATEVYKNATRECNAVDRVIYLIGFANSLWKEIKTAQEEEENDDQIDNDWT